MRIAFLLLAAPALLAAQTPEQLNTPGAVIDYVASETAAEDGMDEEEHRDHVAAIIGELMARTLGITRYREDWSFVEDLKVR